MNNCQLMLYGIFARFVNLFIPAKKKHWVFGSDYGKTYREGSKYMIEYLTQNNPDIHCVFITENKDVQNDLRKKKITCYLNSSLKGIFAIAKADAVFTTQYTNDINFVYKKKNRTFYYIIHGQPYKKSYDMSLSDSPIPLITKIKKWLIDNLLVGYDIHEVSFMSVTSDYLAPFLSESFSGKVPIKVLGAPRNDRLFDQIAMKKETWVDGTEGKTIITFMPTHRNFGEGELSPIPFVMDQEKQRWLFEHNVILLMKQHPNMVPKIKEFVHNNVIYDISDKKIDPMTAVFHSDILITDHSSVWLDFLLMRRPLLFYMYDNFVEDSAGVFYNLNDIAKDYCCYDEETLFARIQEAVLRPQTCSPSAEFVAKFHKYIDKNSCQRHYREIVKEKYGEE